MRHTGHLPGLVSRSLFLYIKPHVMHSGGIMISLTLFLPRVFRICSRCPYTSFSGIPTYAEISLAESFLSLSREIISCLIVWRLSGDRYGGFCVVFLKQGYPLIGIVYIESVHKCLLFVMPDLIRYPERIENTGFSM